MFRFFVGILFLLPSFCLSQVNDDFSDGNFTSDPEWTGTTDKFTVNSGHMLQLSAPAEASAAWLFTKSRSIENAEWKLRVVLYFNPSSNNYTRIYLAADTPEPANIKNAIYVEIGKSTDDISLYSIQKGETSKLIDGENDRVDLSVVDVKIDIVRQGDTWTLRSNTGSGWKPEGTCTFRREFTSSYFGLYCKYTSTRSTKFYFDDIVVTGEPYKDEVPPYLTSFKLLNGERMSVSFSEPVDTLKTSTMNFTLKNEGRHPAQLEFKREDEVELRFAPALNNVSNDSLLVTGIADLSGNVMADTAVVYSYTRVAVKSAKAEEQDLIRVSFTKPIDKTSLNKAFVRITPGSFSCALELRDTCVVDILLDEPLAEGAGYTMELSGFADVSGDTIRTTQVLLFYNKAKRFDVAFSEIMPDPDPPVALPESEYVELYNRTGHTVDLKDWKLLVNGKVSVLPGDTIKPGGYVLLIPESKQDEWGNIPNKIAVSPWQAITNDECDLVLVSSKGNVVDALKYSFNKWNDGSFKKDGGWSFERVDVNNMSGEVGNWIYSVDPSGGTPGSENSVKGELPDEVSPEVTTITYEDPQTIKIHFSEPVDLFSDDLINKFEIKNSSIRVKNIIPDTVFLDNCNVAFETEMKTNVVHEFSKIGLSDLAGNELVMNANRFFGRPDIVSVSDHEIVINEILFNPRHEGYDFVELLNRSGKILDLKDIFLADTDDEDNVTKIYPLAEENVLFFPGDLLIFTVSPENINYEYKCTVPEWLHEVRSMPSMPDDEGVVTVTTRTGAVIDRLHYSAGMHFPLLNDVEGVSLERVSPETVTDDPSNWKSASADCGYATPTGQNSQFKDVEISSGTGFSLEEELFSPDGDGYSDFLVLNYSFDEPETVATVRIYNAKGIAVKTIANNKLLGTSGFLTWDGTNDDGKLVSPGIYIILAETYNLQGEKTKQKLTCVVGTRSSP